MQQDSLAENWRHVKDEIARACSDVSRNSDEVCLVAVSKMQSYERIKELYALGQRDFAESYAQEFHEKFMRARDDGLHITWHFIGNIQSNKLKLIKDAAVVHTISSLRHAQMLDELCTEAKSVYVQINLADIANQQGVNTDEACSLIASLHGLTHVRVDGLMMIAPIDSPQPPAYWFGQMTELSNDILAHNLLPTVRLSMGMSDDFVDAIHHGADLVRVGTSIFGERR